MPKEPVTLEDVKAALDRLGNVVDRLADRVNELEDVKTPLMQASIDEASDTITFLMDRTDEVGATAIKAGRDLGQRIDPDVPADASASQRMASRVKLVRVNGKTVQRRAG